MMHKAFCALSRLGSALVALLSLSACSMMTDDLSDCPQGLYVSFRYDYNLERADLFSAHVGALTLYVFDKDGHFVKAYNAANDATRSPLHEAGYRLHITDLPAGDYQFLALASQSSAAQARILGQASPSSLRAAFVADAISAQDSMSKLTVRLERTPLSGNTWDIVHHGEPLDTLWRGMQLTPVAVEPEKVSQTTVSLVRDTKRIRLSLRELDDPTQMDIDNYDVVITDRNATLRWDNTVDERAGVVRYTPYTTWNTTDRTPALGPDGEDLGRPGRIGHAELMTSRLIWHGRPQDDATLRVRNRQTGVNVAMLNLPDLLCQLRGADELHRYGEQEFLDRGYDYDIDIFLRGDRLAYIDISIGVLGWSKRKQYEEL